MSKTGRDPWEIASMGELLELARYMEQEAIDGYVALAARMREMGRHELAVVFDSLVAEERSHLNKVADWQDALETPCAGTLANPPEELFDDEGAGIVAPELLSAYKAFSMAVRNEERAFAFWTYVSAHAQSEEIMQAAERMAREELGHVAKLRRERRRAFHQERGATTEADAAGLQSLERRLSQQLRSMATAAGNGDESRLQALAGEAQARAEALAERPFGMIPHPDRVPRAALDNTLPLCEFLTDCYLDLGDRAKGEQEAERARAFAAEIIHCLRAVRGVVAAQRGAH